MKRIWLIVIFVMLVLGGVLTRQIMVRPLLDPSSSIPRVAAVKQDMRVALISIGVLQAGSSRVITAPYSGKIVKLAPEGSFVKEGDPVAWLETTELEDSLKDFEVQLGLAKAQLTQKEEDYKLALVKNDLDFKASLAGLEFKNLRNEDAKVKYRNQEVLVEKNLAARNTLDEAKLNFLQSELQLKQAEIELKKLKENQASDVRIQIAEIDKAKANLESYQSKVDKWKKRVEDAVIKATGSGNISYMVTWKSDRMGKIAEGDQVWQRSGLIEIPDSSTMLAVVPINEIEIAKVEVGQKSIVKLDAIPDVKFPAVVERKAIVPMTDESRFFFSPGSDRGVKEFEVAVKLDAKDDRLRQGMTATVEITVGQEDNALIVPQEAVFHRNEKNLVYVAPTGDGKPVEREVKTGLTDSNHVAITDGLTTGEMVLLRDPTQPMDKIGVVEGMNTSSGGGRPRGGN